MAKLLISICFLASAFSAQADVQAFNTCFLNKVMVIKSDCHGTCTPQCKAALDNMIASVDGSCCDYLEEGDDMTPAQCKDYVQEHFVKQMQALEAQECDGSEVFAFVFEQLAEKGILGAGKQTPGAQIGIIGMIAMSAVSGMVGALAGLSFTQRRSIAAPTLLG